MRALTDEERENFQHALELVTRRTDQIALLNTELDGQDVAVIVCIHEYDHGSVDVEPLAILVNDDLMSRLARPAD